MVLVQSLTEERLESDEESTSSEESSDGTGLSGSELISAIIIADKLDKQSYRLQTINLLHVSCTALFLKAIAAASILYSSLPRSNCRCNRLLRAISSSLPNSP